MILDADTDDLTLELHHSIDTKNLRVISRGSGNYLAIGQNCVLNAHIFLAGGARLTIGERVKSTGQLAFHLHEGSEVSIGDGCLFSHSITFRPSDAHKIFDCKTGERINPPSPIRIGKRVWVGEQVLVLKGAEVSDDSVVGARSTLTSAFVEPNLLIVGTPARVVRNGIRWQP